MKRFPISFVLATVGVLFLALAPAAQAVNPNHQTRLLASRRCERCNLRQANLSDAFLQGANPQCQ
jgi:uncharacterized protein YjbI with pentapeptide repeats